MQKRQRASLWGIVALLLLGALLRSYELGGMWDMTNFDEAYYGLDALSLLEHPRLTPFFPQNFGRESLWMYWVAPFLAVFNASSIGLRLPALFAGMLALPALYVLASRLFSRRVALWAVAGLAVLYWHVHLSHISWRVILFPTVGMLAWAALWQARAKNTSAAWGVSGVLMGALGYTYFSARTWLALYALLLAWWFWREASLRRGVLLASALTLLVLLPLGIYTLTTVEANVRANQVLVTRPRQVLTNALAWLPMWFIEGPRDEIHGYAGRPILDVGLTVLTFAGFASLWAWRHKREVLMWGVLLLGASLAPAVLSDDATHLRRSFGVVLPLAVLLGLGASWLETQLVCWRVPRLLATGALLALLGTSALTTAHDFSQWARSGKAYVLTEQFLYRMVNQLERAAPPSVPLYFSPYAYNHPVLNFLRWKVGERPIGTFEAHECVVIPNAPRVLYASAALYDLPLDRQLAPFMRDIALWYEEPDYAPAQSPRYKVWQAEPSPKTFAGWQDAVTFANGAQVRSLFPSELIARAGEPLWLDLAWRADVPLDRQMSYFVHLYDAQTPYEGGRIWAQNDGGLCLSHPPFVWRSDEVIVQFILVLLPEDLPPNSYTVAIGMYDTQTLARARLLAPSNPHDYVPAARLRVE